MHRLLWIVPLSLLISGCAITRFGNTFEGASDFRIVPAGASATTAQKDCEQIFRERTTTPPRSIDLPAASDRKEGDAGRIAVSLGCYSRFQFHPGVATTKPADPSFFQSGEKIAIFLKTARIAFFTEGFLEEQLNHLASSPVKGEIAILANVTQGVRNPGSLGADGQLQGRVVFYGNDIYQAQTIDEFNVPIAGPETYTGGPLTIDLWVLELDQAESQQFGSVLKTLTSLASKAAGLPPGGGQILNQIGTAFLNSNRDDVIGHIALTLVPPRPGLALTDPLLRESDIIIQRSEGTFDRSEGVTFDDCYYEPLQAKVYCPANGRVPNRNMLTLAVRRTTATAQLVSDVSLAEMNRRLGQASGLHDVSDIIEEAADQAAGRAKVEEALQLIDRIADPGTPRNVAEMDGLRVIGFLQCSLLAEEPARTVPAKGPAAMASEGQAEVASTQAMVTTEATYETFCGHRSTRRAATSDELNLLGRRIIQLLTVEPDDLNHDALLGSGTTHKQSELDALARALLNKFRFRPPPPPDAPD